MPPSHGRYAYSPIVSRPFYRWPNGAGLALYIALGVEDYVFGEGKTEDIIAGASKPDMVNTSWRDYGNRVGVFRLLQRFQTLGLTPAILLNTEIYESAPAVIEAARAAGAEMVAHGRSNSDTLAAFTRQEEEAYVAAVAGRIRKNEGRAPAGWSSPWLAHSPNTLGTLKRAGFSYLLDLRLDDQPVWLDTDAGRLLSLPYALELNDSSTIIGRYASAREFAGMIIDEFEEMLAQSRHQPLVMSIVVHSFISGQPFRLRALTVALERILLERQSVWLATPGEIAAFIAEEPSRAV